MNATCVRITTCYSVTIWSFTITAEILARSLSISGQAHELVIYALRQQARADSLTIVIVKRHCPSLSNPIVIFGKCFTFPGFYVRLTPS